MNSKDWLSELIDTLQKAIQQLQATTIANSNEVGSVKLEVGKQAAKLDLLLTQVSDLQRLEAEKIRILEQSKVDQETELGRTKSEHKKQILLAVITAASALGIGLLNLLSQGITPRDPKLGPIGAQPYHESASEPRAQSTP